MSKPIDFRQLLGGLSWQAFISRYWQRESYHISRTDSGYFKSLISREEVDFLISTHGGKADFIISLIGGKTGNAADGTGHKPRSYWTAANTYKAFQNGSTIRIGNMAGHSLAIHKLKQHFEASLQTDVHINLYLTPPDSSAFGAHYDEHDVFIIQISGSKTWKLSSPAEDSPVEVLYPGRAEWLKKELPGKTKLHPLPVPEKEWTITMQEGDLLYVPRGHVHQVQSEAEESLHLTVAVTVVTWYEVVVRALMETLQGSNVLRESLPPNISQLDFRSPYFLERINRVKDDLQKRLTNDIMVNALNDLVHQFIISRHTFQDGESVLAAKQDQVVLSSEMCIRPDLIYRKEDNLREMMLYYSGGYLVIPYHASGMLEYILDKKRFIVKELPAGMTDQSGLNLTRLLFCSGFLEIYNSLC